MKGKKRYFVIIGILILIILLLLLLIIYMRVPKQTHYEKVKKESVEFLKKNYSELVKLSEELILEKSEKSVEYQGTTIGYEYWEDTECVEIRIGAQGFLGGQYWGLIYSPNDDYLDGETIKIYNQYITGSGNNIFVYEKIKKKWYFFYEDYDGTIDLIEISH